MVTIPISKLAAMALPYAERKFVKQPVMTDLYGVTPTGARLQIQNLLALEPGLPRENRYPIAHYLAQTILGGIGDVCPSARAAMKWIRECAGRICAKNRPVTWRTPLGLPVVQPHRLLSTVRVQTILQIMTLAIDDSNVPVWPHAQIDGSAPNVLHSIDGTHMMMTGEMAHRKSIDFLATHDRYFSHAANKASVGIINREQFVKLHQSPYLEVLRGQWVSLHPDISFNESPRVGNFDITEVLRSPYFFN
jgi:DNA-directed RNA polymerase